MSVNCILTKQFPTALQTGAIAKKTIYYPTNMGTNLADTVTDSPFLIGISSTNNAGLYNALVDSFAYIFQIFYNDTDRMQLAVGYTNGRIASRINKNGTWSDWIATVNTSQPMTFSINSSGGLSITY